MKDFDYYLNEGKVKKQSKDKEFAISLRNDAVNRAGKVLKLDIKEFSKIIFENIYESLRELLDAALALEGYKSYSHEASIAHIKKFGIDDSVLLQLDDFRYKRNSSKYYGKEISEEDAREIIAFYKENSNRIKDIIERLCK
jgi:hypothetical protein